MHMRSYLLSVLTARPQPAADAPKAVQASGGARVRSSRLPGSQRVQDHPRARGLVHHAQLHWRRVHLREEHVLGELRHPGLELC